MKKLIVAAAFVAMLASCKERKTMDVSKTQEEMSKLTESAPTTVELLDSVYDFGKVAEGQLVEYSFRFKNTGTNPLVITNAVGSCGCTVAEKPEQPVLPGEIGYMKVKFNSENRVGDAHKTVTVSANVPTGFPELLIKGEVLKKS